MCLDVDFATINVSSKVSALSFEDIGNPFILKEPLTLAEKIKETYFISSLVKGGVGDGNSRQVFSVSVAAV